MKKIISALLSICIIACTFSLASFNAFAATLPISVGESVSSTASRGDETYNFWTKFDCQITAYYEFTNTKINEPVAKVYGYLYDENKLPIDVVVSRMSNGSMSLCRKLEAGKTYYFCVKVSNGVYESSTTLNYHIHSFSQLGSVPARCDDDKDFRLAGYSYLMCPKCYEKQIFAPINPALTVELGSYDKYFNGFTKFPAVVVRDTLGLVIDPSNYTVEYIDNVEPGKASAIITFNGVSYAGEITKAFYIYPQKMSITELKAKSKALTVYWAPDYTADGYEIQCSTSKSFPANDTKLITVKDNDDSSKSISGLTAKKKYYVRVRAYKVIKGNYYYSKWSSKQKVTTLK